MRHRVCQQLIVALVTATAVGLTCAPAAARPVPTGTGTITIGYETEAGPVSYSGERDYSGTGPTDATVLVGADNIRVFNSWNSFGRRMIVPGAWGPDAHRTEPERAVGVDPG